MKKLLALVLVLSLCLVIVGCGKENNNAAGEENNNPSGEQAENLTDMTMGEYKVEKKGNSVHVISYDGSSLTDIEYVFKNNAVSEANVTFKTPSIAFSQELYNQMIASPELFGQYENIKINGAKVTASISSQTLQGYAGIDQNTFYNLMTQTYSAFIK